MDNWPHHMTRMMDGRSKHEIPVFDGVGFQSWIWSLLFVFVSIMVCGSVVINLVVGTFVDCYNQNVEGVRRADPPPLHLLVTPLHDDLAADGFRGRVYALVSAKKFDTVIAGFIMANVAVLAVESFKKSSRQAEVDAVSNVFFCLVFGLESMLKLLALRPHRYSAAAWNTFDFAIGMAGFFGVAVDNLRGAALDPSILRLLRVIRVTRVLRALRLFKSLRSLQVGSRVQGLGYGVYGLGARV
jgi:hypothetical protein